MYRVSPQLRDNVITPRQWRVLLEKPVQDNGDARLIEIDLRQQPPDAMTMGEQCKWCWSDCVPQGVVLFFPNTNDTLDHVVETDKYSVFADLDKRIERALKNTKIRHDAIGKQSIDALKMAIASSDYVFRVWGVLQEHTYYVYSMKTFTRNTVDGYVHEPLDDVPALVEMDGSMRIINVVVLDVPHICKSALYNRGKMLLPLDLRSHTRSHWPMNHVMFNCERVPRRRREEPTLNTMSQKMAVHDTKNVEINVSDFVLDDNAFDIMTSSTEQEHVPEFTVTAAHIKYVEEDTDPSEVTPRLMLTANNNNNYSDD